MTSRRGVILPVVLFVLLLVGLLSAMFAFRVNADLASTQAVAERLQTRLAAEAGIERVKLMLQTDRYDMDAWYNNPDMLHRIVVWSGDGDTNVWGTNNEDIEDGTRVYRFSLVADDVTDDEDYIRFGLTDEASKLDLNRATESQLMTLVTAAVEDNQEVDPQEIVNAILDWRDPDSRSRGEEGDAEAEYYRTLDRPYRIKNGAFDTVEELLLVKGMTNQILYGEDFDRNGLLTPNEDDGSDSFPYDNQDNKLNRGLYPYLTVTAFEDNVTTENRPRIYLFGDENTVREQLTEVFPEEPEVVDYIITVTRGQGAGVGQSGGQNRAGPSGRSNTGNPAPTDDSRGGNTGNDGSEQSDKSGTRRQRVPSGEDDGNSGGEQAEEENPESSDSSDPDGQGASEEQGEGDQGDAAENEEGGDGETEESTRSTTGPIQTPVSLLLPRSVGGEVRTGPVGVEHLDALLDQTTVLRPDQRQVYGLINVNTAPRLVLQCLDGLTGEQIGRIIDVRETLSGESKRTFAWLATEDVLDLETLERVAPQLTARGQQFTMEVLGYADHVGMVTRLQVTVDLIGPIAQTIYYRDLSYLGSRFPIREEDLENIRVR